MSRSPDDSTAKASIKEITNMTIVARKGKFSVSADNAPGESAWRMYEDVLTADVFGAYRYLPPSLGLLPLLECAVDEKQRSLSAFLETDEIQLQSFDSARIRFWPTFQNGREPDVLIVLSSSHTGRSIAILVEAKLHAQQHEITDSTGTTSQLGHYLREHLAGNYKSQSVPGELPMGPRPLLYITKHREVSIEELAKARIEVEAAVDSSEVGLFWVDWGTAGLVARSLWQTHRETVLPSPWIRHLLDLYEEVRARDLLPREPFLGIPKQLQAIERIPYERTYFETSVEARAFTRIYTTTFTASLCLSEEASIGGDRTFRRDYRPSYLAQLNSTIGYSKRRYRFQGKQHFGAAPSYKGEGKYA